LTTTPLAADVVCQLRSLLETIGDALVAGDLGPLLESERQLALALTMLSVAELPASLPAATQRAMAEDIRRCRDALARCRRLGWALDQYVATTFDTAGRAGTYTRAGDAAVVAPAGALEARG
jgi:hypothetical protein